MKYLLILLILFPVSVYAQQDSLIELSLSEMKFQSAGGMNYQTSPFKISPGLSGTEFYPQYQPLNLKPNYPVLGAVGGVFLGAGIAVHIYQRNAWWKDQRRSFHFVNDADYALGIDKVGHFYAGSLLAHAFSAGLEAGNIQSEQAAIYGSIASLIFELYVEIEDGYGPQWGFSPGDAIGDVLGAGYSLGQYYVPFLKNFQPRFSYIPSQESRDGIHKGNMIDDYDGQKYWMAVRVKNLLPEAVSTYWPSFLMISVGMGVKDRYYADRREREFYIALDLDAEELPLYGRGWQFVKNTLNYFHFPMPGIRITPDAAFFVIVF